ncbi:MAG: DUF2066 domain-containing protein [Gammaproteobacteria bacterium]|nr:DUF2066 domain-containing protein [Gammaproteobacteria bacterium]
MRGWMTLVALLLALPLQADVIEDLYLATVPVESQDREERQEAIRTGLNQVLVRVTGSNQVLTAPGIEAALNQPTRYAQRFRYQQQDKDGKKQQVLWMLFDEGAITKLLHDNQMPVWGRTRPATLLWLVVDDRRKRNLISNDKQAEARLIIEEQAKLRGLPLRLPLYDLTDRANLSVTDIWGNFEEAILRASSRYQTEAVLVGRVYRAASNSWSGRWTLYTEGRQQNWQTSGESLAVAMLPGISQTTEILAQRYTQVDSVISSDQLRVQINGVSGLAAYTRVVKYLDSLDAITQVQPHSIASDSVVLSLTSRRGQLAVSQAIALGHTLVVEPSQPVSPPAPPAGEKNPSGMTPSADLVYRLVP